ncbi:hypothetical protein [Muribaculum intestinale]|uniref:hypothetical protein n=1 Tax=Muribaculum intestinale TaxID=1796646 RepID=UPI003F672D36
MTFTFDSPGYGVSCYTRHSEVKLGTSGSFVTANNVTVDSLLTLSMSTDYHIRHCRRDEQSV